MTPNLCFASAPVGFPQFRSGSRSPENKDSSVGGSPVGRLFPSPGVFVSGSKSPSPPDVVAGAFKSRCSFCEIGIKRLNLLVFDAYFGLFLLFSRSLLINKS